MSSPAQIVAETNPDGARTEKSVAILLIEDEPSFQFLVEEELKDASQMVTQVEAVARLSSAIDRLAKTEFDVILTDLNLPDCSGVETFNRLVVAAKGIPIIVLSSQGDDAMSAQILRRGAQDFISKSRIAPGVLVRIIRRAIERQRYASELDQHARQLEESEGRVRAIYNASADAAVVTDKDGMVQFANPAAGRMFGRDVADLVHHFFGMPIVAGSTTEVDIHQSDGSVGVAEMHVVSMTWNDRPAYLATLRDVTGRKRSEQRLRESEEQFRLLLEHAVDYTFIMLDANGNVRTWNAGAERTEGYAASEMIGRPFDPFPISTDHPGDRLPTTELFSHARRGGRVRAEGWRSRKDGSQYWAEVVTTPIRDSDNQLLGFAVVTHNLTERRVSEEQRREMEHRLRSAQKLEAIGQLAAGIAHEINTPAQFISHNLTYVQKSFDSLAKHLADLPDTANIVREGGQLHELIREIPLALGDAATGISRVTKIVQAMKEFSHPGSAGFDDQPIPADINQNIESTITVAQHEWRLVAELEKSLDPTLPVVPLFVGEFNQVILNLLVNAAQAVAATGAGRSRARGLIRVATKRTDFCVEVLISDTGIGIPEAVQHRIFEPFFTTKEIGKGTGQGLAHAHAVITKRHLGKLDFRSTPGRGTTFMIRLPFVSGAIAANI